MESSASRPDLADDLGEIKDQLRIVEYAVLGVPVNGHPEDGVIQELTETKNFVKGLFFTVLAANVIGGVIAASLFLLIK